MPQGLVRVTRELARRDCQSVGAGPAAECGSALVALHPLPVDEGFIASDFDQHVAVAAVPDVAQNAFAGQRQRELSLGFGAQMHLGQERCVHRSHGQCRSDPGPARGKPRGRGCAQNHAHTRLIQLGTRLTGG